METLREVFVELGFDNVRSYINSGNIFFNTDIADKKQLTTSIEQRLNERLGYEVPTFLRSTSELEAVLSQDPFKTTELTDDKRFCVIFTNEPINLKSTLPYLSSKNDMELISANPYEAFVVWHIINGRPPAGKFSEDMIPPKNTTRFYHTLTKIVQAAKV